MPKFSVPDMSCDHCRATIEKALAAVPGAGPVHVDLDAQQVTTEGAADSGTIVAALDEAGYPASEVASS